MPRLSARRTPPGLRQVNGALTTAYPDPTTTDAGPRRACVRWRMAGASLTPASFSLACPAGTPVTATVGYDATATLTPGAALPASTTCVATVTTAAQDTVGLAMASDYVWSFSTAADTTAPAVSAINPADAAKNLCLTTLVTATFSEAMDPLTINTTNVAVTDGGAPVAGTVSDNSTTRVASFVVTNPAGFAASRPFVVTIRSGTTGVKDEAGNALAADRVFGFTTGTQPCAAAVNLQTAASFGAFGGGAGVTNQGVNTVVGGDLTLDAQGNADAVWVFQMQAALTVGLTATPRTVLLINGGQARNVFWQVGSAARIEDGSTMVGTLIAPAGVTISTAGQTAQPRPRPGACGALQQATGLNICKGNPVVVSLTAAPNGSVSKDTRRHT